MNAIYENSKTFFAGEVLPSDKGKIDFEFISDEELYFQSKLENISPSWLTSTALEIQNFGLI